MKETSSKTKIGFNLLVWSGGLPDTFLPITERLKKIGYDGVECFMEERNNKAYSKLGNHLKSIGLEATCVLGVGPDENPISKSKAIRDKAIVRLKEAIDCSEAIGSKIICGPFHSAFATFACAAYSPAAYNTSALHLYSSSLGGCRSAKVAKAE